MFFSFIFVNDLKPVAQSWISANPGLKLIHRNIFCISTRLIISEL